MVCLQVAPGDFADAIALARRHAETGELSKFFGLCIEIADALARARDRSVVQGVAIPESLKTAQEEIDKIMAEPVKK